MLRILTPRNRTLLRQFVITDFKLRYQGSLLGYLWSLAKPMMLFGILYIVFAKFARFGDATENYPTQLLLGIVLWTYFVETTTSGMSSIVGRGDLIRKASIPKYNIVLASSLSALINLFFNLIVVFIVMLIDGVSPSVSIIWLPLLILELFTLATGCAFMLSALFVRFRDISHIWDVVLQVLFYATPIIYPLALVPVRFLDFLMLNPLAQIFQDARAAVVTPRAVQSIDVLGPVLGLIPYVIVVTIAVVAAIYFRKSSPSFAENV